MAKYDINLPSQVPNTVPAQLWSAFNDLYTQLAMLTQELNRNADILQSPDGHYWRTQVSNAGVITTTDLGTVLP